MTQQHDLSSGSVLPHHRLLVYRKALELLGAVRGAQISDAKLRDEALRAAKGVCLNGPPTILGVISRRPPGA